MVYLLTDGGDSISRASASDVTKTLLRYGARLSAAVFYDPWAVTAEERFGPEELEGTVKATGGFYTGASAWDSKEPDKISLRRIDLLTRLSNHQYKLVLKTPVSQRSLKWKLRLTNLPVDLKGFKALYPRELPACSGQPAH